MRKNEAGLAILEIGDVIRKGKGKVLYTVTWVPEEHLYGTLQPEVKSNNTGALSRINIENATLVQNVRDTEEWKAANAEEPVQETSAYAKAVLFALNKLQKHVYAGTVSKTKKAKTRKLNRRQKASRKANR